MRDFFHQMGDTMESADSFRLRKLKVVIASRASCVAVCAGQCERRLWRTTLAMLLTWSLAWTPYALMFLASGQLQRTLDKLSTTRLLSVTGHRHFISNHIGMGTGMSSIYYYRIRKENIMQYLFSELFCKVSVSVNPFIYGLM